MATKQTPLAKALAQPDAPTERATPLDAFKMARRWWLKGYRLNLSALAIELGVSRATLMRWVGNRELLLREILWSLYQGIFERAKARADAMLGLSGIDYLTQIYHDINTEIIEAEPLARFIADDPKFFLQMQMASGLQQRFLDSWAALFKQEIAAGRIDPQMDPEHLAYFIVRIGEGALYSDLICGRKPELGPASTAFRLLLSARSEA